MHNYFVVMLLLLVSMSAHADYLYYGWQPQFYSYSINDPDGPTVAQDDYSVSSLIAITETSRDRRLYSGLSYHNFTIRAEGQNIGQHVKAYNFYLSRQHYLRFTRSLKIWAGYGLGMTNGTYTKRHKVDTDGFLIESFEDRKINDMYALINFSNDWKIENSYYLGYYFSYQKSIDNGLEGYSLGLAIYY